MADGQERAKRLLECIESLVWQFGYYERRCVHSGGISALEEAFACLGWDDPHPAPPELLCDVPGCGRAWTCGWPAKGGYRHVCDKHAAEARRRRGPVAGAGPAR